MDRREAILARLVEVCRGLPGIQAVVRNKTEISGRRRPAVTIMDADEEADDKAFERGRRPGPNIVACSPEVYILCSREVTPQVGDNDDDVLGPLLNGFRLALLKALYADETMLSLVTHVGEIQYRGCSTDLSRGKSMEGEMIFNVTFRYPLLPQEF